MKIQITSYDSDTHRRDRVEKPDGHAAAGIPVYLPFGASVKLPAPVNITLDTEPLKELVD